MATSAKLNEAAPVSSQGNSNVEALAPRKAVFDFLDLKAQFRTIRDEVMGAVTRVMESQIFILGSEVKALEEEYEKEFASKFAVSCASGTDALVLALTAAGVGKDDEVITTPFSFVATAGSIARIGAKPVFIDIDPASFNLDPDLIAAAVTPKTKAVMPVHLFGLAADMNAVETAVAGKNIAVVEDAAQAIGSKFNNEFVGNLGDFGCFSFFPSKNLGGAGDGGLVTAQTPEAADKLRLLRAHGSRKKYHHEILGTNSRLDALQAAILRVKLPHLADWTSGRRARAQRYRELFEEFNLTSAVSAPAEPPAAYYHVYNQFSIRSSDRDALRGFLRNSGIPTEVYYPIPLHLQPAFSYLGYAPGDFPKAEAASREVIALPVFPELTEEQQYSVVQAIAKFYQR
jgi:dTDP-4-amino-4,6-dideoxygalactose transaminase